MRNLRERVGSAINAGSLRGAVLTILNGFAVGASPLGRRLWRIRYGDDRTIETREYAKALLIEAIRGCRHKLHPDFVSKLAEAVFEEWVSAGKCPDCGGRQFTGTAYGDLVDVKDACPSCHGKGKIPGATVSMFATAQEVMLNRVCCQSCGGRGWQRLTQVDAAKVAACRTCDGTGRLKPTPEGRAARLEVSLPQYLRHCDKAYEWALGLLHKEDTMTAAAVSHALRSLEGLPMFCSETIASSQEGHYPPLTDGVSSRGTTRRG